MCILPVSRGALRFFNEIFFLKKKKHLRHHPKKYSI
jgi:hypothetical protein